VTRPGTRAAAWLVAGSLLVGAGVVHGWGDDGRDGPWLARYTASDGEAFERFESDVRAHWGGRAPRPGWNSDGFTQRFETCIAADVRQVKLTLGADDAVSLQLGDVPLFERGRGSKYRETALDVVLPEVPTLLVVEARDLAGSSSVQLWRGHGDAERTSLPATWLSRPPCD